MNRVDTVSLNLQHIQLLANKTLVPYMCTPNSGKGKVKDRFCFLRFYGFAFLHKIKDKEQNFL